MNSKKVPERVKLTWQTYSDHLRLMLHDMMKADDLTDVTLVSDDKQQFRAHKVVLSACSPVFKSIIDNLPQNNSVIYLRGILHPEMESILKYIYLGEVKIYQKRMNEFLEIARNLEIKTLYVVKDKTAEMVPEKTNAEKKIEDEYEFEVTDNEKQIPTEKVHTKENKNQELVANENNRVRTDVKHQEEKSVKPTVEEFKSNTNEQLEMNISNNDFVTAKEMKNEKFRCPESNCDYQATQKGVNRHFKREHRRITDID